MPILTESEAQLAMEHFGSVPKSDPAAQLVCDAANARAIVEELARREREPLDLFTPLPKQQMFHDSNAKELLLFGSNRSGKTLNAAAFVARIVRGRSRRKDMPKKNGRCFCVGYDLNHIGQVMWRKLSRPGAFKVLRDPVTRQWRTPQVIKGDIGWEVDPDDWALRSKWLDAEPLIPENEIAEIAWENKREGVPKCVRLINGWELFFFSSKGDPNPGADVNLVWVDEEVERDEWISEMAYRGIVDRSGCFFWSATPQSATEKMWEMHLRCEDVTKPNSAEFKITISENPYLSREDKRDFYERLSPLERIYRFDGDFAITGLRVYPELDMSLHCCEPFPIPPHWTRYMVTDPGRQVCAVLFAAVPPPEEGNQIFIYDELYLKNSTAELYGEEAAKVARDHAFEAFIIDGRYGRQASAVNGQTIEDQYSAQLQKNKLRSRQTGSGYIRGCDDVKARESKFRSWLPVQRNGKPRVQIFAGRCANLWWELGQQWYVKKGSQITDKRIGKNDHLVDCIEYLAAFDPEYVTPRRQATPITGVLKRLQEKLKRKRGREQSICLGPVSLGKGRKSA